MIVRHAKSGPDSLDESVAWKFEAFDRTSGFGIIQAVLWFISGGPDHGDFLFFP